MNRKLNIVKVIDQWGWAYDFLGKEQRKYSKHNIIIQKYNDLKLDGVDIVYIHGPNISTETTYKLPLIAKEKNIKVIGAFAGDPFYWSNDTPKCYEIADLIITISPETYKFASKVNQKFPIIFLPEGVDSNFFTQKCFNPNSFTIGWTGSNLQIKRQFILDQLRLPIKRQSDWGESFFVKDRTLEPMKNFYHSIDALVLPSITECMPRVVLEAMACGLPVISTNVGNIHFLLERMWITAVTPTERVIKEMNLKLDILYRNIELRRKTGMRNRQFIEQNFCWSKIQHLWDNVFENLVNNDIDKIISQLPQIRGLEGVRAFSSETTG